jgi:hypothetical protein
MPDGRARGLRPAGLPAGCATPGDPGHVIESPAPATSNRACYPDRTSTGTDDELASQLSTRHSINRQSVPRAQEHSREPA